LRTLKERQSFTRKLKPADFVFAAPTARCATCGQAGHMDKPNKATAAVKRALGLQDERGFLHHIRRTVSDRMRKDLGIAPFVVEAILGHVQQGLAKTYMPSDPAVLMREALEQWSAHLARVLRSKSANAA